MKLSPRSLAVFAAAAIAVRAGAAAETVDDVRKQGWLQSGRKISMGSLVSRAGELPPGVFEILAPAGKVRSILSAGDSIWVGTDGGLFVWIPQSDTVFAEKGPGLVSVSSIAAGDDGEIWVGGEAGLSIRHDWGWERFTRAEHPFFSRVTDIRNGEGKMWVSTWGHGCGYVRGDTLTVMTRADSLLDDRVTCVAEQGDNTIWIGTCSGVCRADSFSWTSMRYGSRLPVGMVRDMILTEEGDLFVSVARQGVARYSLGRVSIYGPGQGLTDREIYQFGLDAAARVWAAGRGGLSTWDGSGWTPVRLEGAALGARDYTAVSHDPEGGTYLGSSDGVIIALTRDSFLERQLPAHGPERKIGLVAAGGGAVYLAGLKAVYRYDGEFTPIELPGSWFEGTVTGLLPERGGGLWLSTRFGILHYTGSVWEVFDRRQGLPTENFTCAAAGERGELWFGTFDRGVLRLTAEGWVHYRRTHGLPDERITSMAAGRPGTIWVSTVSGRVAGFNGKSWETLDIVEPSEPARPALPPADSVLFDDPSVRLLPQQGSDLEGSFPPVIGIDGSGRCMFCTTEGVYFQSEAGWRLIDTPAVRSGVRPTALRGTIDGNIWLGTSGAGVFCLTGGEWLHVDSTTGLGSDNVLSIEEDRSGTVWIGTMDGGVTRYRSGVR